MNKCLYKRIAHLRSSGGDLLAEVGSGHDLLGEGDAVVLQVHDLELVAHDRVVVHHLGHLGEERKLSPVKEF